MTTWAPVPLLVIGGSAGSLPPLLDLVETLPVDLAAAVVVCQHTGEHVRSHLPDILDRRSPLSAAWAEDGEQLQAGRIYVGPPAHHVLIQEQRARLSRGPRVNRHRPSVDVLFASAAQAVGPASTAVVLSGVLDDGAVGAALIDLSGGQVLVQDPDAAEFGSMPTAALAAAPRASIMSSDAIGAHIGAAVARASKASAANERSAATKQEVNMQAEIPSDPGFLKPGENRLTRMVCPECGGGLAQIDLPQISYFRCHVGHQYAPQSLAAAQAEASEQKLWGAVAALEEQAVMQNYLEGTGILSADTNGPSPAGTFRSSAQALADRAAALREQVQQWTGEPRTKAEGSA